jgi:hypothetical protein
MEQHDAFRCSRYAGEAGKHDHDTFFVLLSDGYWDGLSPVVTAAVGRAGGMLSPCFTTTFDVISH